MPSAEPAVPARDLATKNGLVVVLALAARVRHARPAHKLSRTRAAHSDRRRRLHGANQRRSRENRASIRLCRRARACAATTPSRLCRIARYFMDQLDRTLRESAHGRPQRLPLFYIDIDRFTLITTSWATPPVMNLCCKAHSAFARPRGPGVVLARWGSEQLQCSCTKSSRAQPQYTITPSFSTYARRPFRAAPSTAYQDRHANGNLPGSTRVCPARRKTPAA